MHISFAFLLMLSPFKPGFTFGEEQFPLLSNINDIEPDIRRLVQESFRDTMKHEIDKLKQEYAKNETKLTDEIEHLKHEYAKNRAADHIEINTLKNTVASLQNDRVQLEKRLNELQSKTKGMKTQTPAIGFTMSLSTLISTSEFDILKFIKVITNYGAEYNITSGKFSCAVPGLYLFQLTILSNSADASAHIVRNGTHLSKAYTSTEKSDEFFGGSVSLVLTLAKYDSVYVESDGEFFFGGDSFFSGVLISSSE